MARQFGLYGTVALERGWCPECENWAFVLDGELQCCRCPYDERTAPTNFRVSSPPFVRKCPKKAVKEKILQFQAHRCFYCGQDFGTFIWRKRKLIQLSPRWDHVIPWIYGQDNHDENFVAACQICNGHKSSKMFKTLKEIREYVKQKWATVGVNLPNLPDLPKDLPSAAALADYL